MASPPSLAYCETKRPEKIFLKLGEFWAREHRRASAGRDSTFRPSRFFLAARRASLCFGFCFVVRFAFGFAFVFAFFLFVSLSFASLLLVRLLCSLLCALRFASELGVYFIACSMWWLNRSSSFVLIVSSIVSFARPLIIWGTDNVLTASIGVRPSLVRWKGRVLPPFPEAMNVPGAMEARAPLMIVALTVYFLGGATIATGDPRPVAIAWPGTLSFLACCPLGLAFGDWLK
jgi:predicted membrane protein